MEIGAETFQRLRSDCFSCRSTISRAILRPFCAIYSSLHRIHYVLALIDPKTVTVEGPQDRMAPNLNFVEFFVRFASLNSGRLPDLVMKAT
jgi:hypothetical protein